MRPLFHPPAEALNVQAILHALADPERARIFAEVVASQCLDRCASVAQAGGRVIPKSSLSQHFRILREAGLVRSERVGVEMRNTARSEEVEAAFPGLLPAIFTAYGFANPCIERD